MLVLNCSIETPTYARMLFLMPRSSAADVALELVTSMSVVAAIPSFGESEKRFLSLLEIAATFAGYGCMIAYPSSLLHLWERALLAGFLRM